MKTLTVLGTRPEIIRLSKIIPKLDAMCQHIFVHTGQSYDYNMSKVFFDQLKLREPDYYLNVKSTSLAEQLSKIMTGIQEIIVKEQVNKLLVLGDTNSGLAALIAKRYGVKVYHMEAGNRCYDDRVPEEVNRRVIDACSDILMPYTERSRQNLIAEGYNQNRVYVTGNPIYEVITGISNTQVLKELNLKDRKYILVTAHRQENVDNFERLRMIILTCVQLGNSFNVPVVFSRHPRTAVNMKRWGIGESSILFQEPFGLDDFLTLERHSMMILTDSGTVSEEACIYHVPCITIRDVTERPETIECGGNILAGVDPSSVLMAARTIQQQAALWLAPDEYTRENVSDTVVKIMAGV